jgi:glycosyltransferase involved in cell wall biosynthesis
MQSSEKLKISVILPNWNGANHIEKCIDSILLQSYTNFEILVIDAKSTDKSHEIIANYIQQDARITHIIDTEDNCLSNAVNVGIKNATGDYAIWIGGDDYFVDDDVFTDSINFIVNYNKQNQHNGIIFYGGYIIDWVASGVQEKRPKSDLDYYLMWMTDSIMCGNVFFNLDFCKQHTIKLSADYRYGMDYDLWLQMIRKFNNRRQIKAIPDRYIHVFTQSGQNITGGNMTASAMEAMQIALKYSGNNYAKKLGIYAFIGIQLAYQKLRDLFLKTKTQPIASFN